jgi:adenylosuccinate synthase
MSKQESQILSELTELKDKISKVKDIFKTDVATIGQTISNKVNLDTYKFTDKEKQVKQEIEELMEFLNRIVNEFYQYDETDLDKLIIK